MAHDSEAWRLTGVCNVGEFETNTAPPQLPLQTTSSETIFGGPNTIYRGVHMSEVAVSDIGAGERPNPP
jgi:hypothetical protein